jgi:hypothetical protein
MALTLNLVSADIEPLYVDVVIPGSWQLDIGTRIRAVLDGGHTGILEVTDQVSSNRWYLRWEHPDSQLDGRTFELTRTISGMYEVSVNPATDNWHCRLELMDQEGSARS